MDARDCHHKRHTGGFWRDNCDLWINSQPSPGACSISFGLRYFWNPDRCKGCRKLYDNGFKFGGNFVTITQPDS